MANSLTIERDKKNKTEIKQMTDTHRHTRKYADVKTNRKERTKQYTTHAL